MTLERSARTVLIVLACVVGGRAALAQPSAQELKSPALTAELQRVMGEKKLDAIALPDPESAGGFIAVLVIPKVQLLAVSARHPSTEYVAYQIQQKKYRDVYSVLQQPDATPGRVFFQDIGADGLNATPGSVDVMYVSGKQTMLDGEGKDAARKLREADEHYSRLLRHALAAAQAYTGGGLR